MPGAPVGRAAHVCQRGASVAMLHQEKQPSKDWWPPQPPLPLSCDALAAVQLWHGPLEAVLGARSAGWTG